MKIRPETAGDVVAIRNVTLAAFRDHPYGDGTENLVVERLRGAGVLAISLVAEQGGMIVGHVAFSPVGLSSGARDWFGLGPISVLPEMQGKGIGGALIREGLAALRNIAASGCVVMGDPELYRKFGFANDSGLVLEDCAPQYFLALPLSSIPSSGIVQYHPAFYAGHG